MNVHTVTGDPRDYIELVPDTIEETAALVFVGTSKFVPPGSVDLLVTPEARPFLALRVYLGPSRGTQLSRETRDALDRES